MQLRFFENSLESGMLPTPNEMYRDNQQAFIDEQWDNTSAKTPENGGAITEQTEIGSSEYVEIEAWVRPMVSDVTRGLVDSRDYLKLIFKSIDHDSIRGLFYTFDDNYWIVYDFNRFNGLAQDTSIRRCNNNLRIIDPENGSVFSIPCVVDYGMESPNVQLNRYVITPNGHIFVMTQANQDSLRLLTLNKRFVLDGRVFKINSFQNSLENSISNQKPTILYIDMYLDEQHANDDMINQIADNGEYNYNITISDSDLTVLPEATGALNAIVTLNGEEVSKNIEWETSDEKIVKVNKNGEYEVVGEIGESATITVYLEGNQKVTDSITITVVENIEQTVNIIVTPSFDKIRQYQTLEFEVKAEYNGTTIDNLSEVDLIINSNAVTLTEQDNKYYLKCNQISSQPITMTVNVSNDNPAFTATQEFNFRAVSMMG